VIRNRLNLLVPFLLLSCGGPTTTSVEVTSSDPDVTKPTPATSGGSGGRGGAQGMPSAGNDGGKIDAAVPTPIVDAGVPPAQDAATALDAATPPPKLDAAAPPPKLDAAAPPPKLDAAAPPPKLDAASPPPLKEVAAIGTAFRWWQLTTEAGVDNQSAMIELNDGDATTGRPLANQDDEIAAWEAGGIVWDSPLAEVTQLAWTNGEWDADRNGAFTANVKLQISVDGTAWTDAPGFSMSPDYAYDTEAVSKATYTFKGSATNVRGIRVIGQVRTGNDPLSYRAAANELSVLGR
jgi:hypothetical protein